MQGAGDPFDARRDELAKVRRVGGRQRRTKRRHRIMVDPRSRPPRNSISLGNVEPVRIGDARCVACAGSCQNSQGSRRSMNSTLAIIASNSPICAASSAGGSLDSP